MTEKDSYQNKKESEECYRKFLKKCELMKQDSWLRCKNVMLREFDFDAEFLAIAE